METSKLSDYKGGWFIGDFFPSILYTKDFEVAIKHYNVGQSESSHHHKVATEITVIVKGSALMNGNLKNEGDVVFIEKGESTDFIPLTDTITCVIKMPSVIGDKYITNNI
jgi:mannose-6-phosphate isomerase-like protein (cupin superfamily)